MEKGKTDDIVARQRAVESKKAEQRIKEGELKIKLFDIDQQMKQLQYNYQQIANELQTMYNKKHE